MKNLKKENGAITVVTLVTILFIVSFLMSSYIIVANKVKTQKEMLNETKKVYESTSTMEEIYNSYFRNGNVIPIYTVDQLLLIGKGQKNVNVNGKYYDFNNSEDIIYVLMNDLSFRAEDYKDKLTDEYWTPIGDNEDFVAKFEGRGHTIEVTYSDGIKVYDKNNNYSDKIPEYSKAKQNNDGTLAQNARWIDNTGTAVIPAGFKVINGIENNQKVSNGLVIQDSDGNEFVWIPVDVPEGKTFDDVFYRSEWEDNERVGGLNTYYTEPYAGGYNGEVDDYNAMKTSVEANKGFYIGRYEAGSVDKITGQPKARTSESAGEGKMVVKRDQYPYNYVAWGLTMKDIDSPIEESGYGAVYLCKHFYDDKKEKVGVTPTLCYGVQWDAILDFIKSEKNVSSSVSWGNYNSSSFTIDRQEAQYAAYSNDLFGAWQSISEEPGNKKEKANSKKILLTTGASDNFAAKNIYDIGGNCFEWIIEAYATNCRTRRGSSCISSGVASVRSNGYPNVTTRGDYSFRPALYINE